MTTRKTAAQRAVERASEAKLAEFYAVNEQKRAIDAEYRRARKAVETLPDGQYGQYLKTYGNPRTITDNDAVAKRFDTLGETVPTKLAHPLVVRRIEKS